MRHYFDMIHNQERVEYLMLQQNLIETIVMKEEQQQQNFLASESSSNVALIK